MLKDKKKQKVQLLALIHAYNKQTSLGVHTSSKCCREACTEGARGGDVCPKCLAGDIEREGHPELVILLKAAQIARQSHEDQDGADPTNCEGPALRRGIASANAAVLDHVNHI